MRQLTCLLWLAAYSFSVSGLLSSAQADDSEPVDPTRFEVNEDLRRLVRFLHDTDDRNLDDGAAGGLKFHS